MSTTLHWNTVLMELGRRDHSPGYGGGAQTGPTRASRAMAMTHLAIYNAVASVVQPSAVYKGVKNDIAVPLPTKGSPLSHVIDGAAHAMLTYLYPRQAKYIDYSLSTPSTSDGFKEGALIAASIIEARMKDGSDAPNPPARPSDVQGAYAKHRTDPFEPGQPELGKAWGNVVRFCAEQAVTIDPYPGHGEASLLSNQKYKDDYLEVLEKGSLRSATRTPDETAIGLYWGYDGAAHLGVPPRLYNEIAREIIAGLADKNRLPSTTEGFELEVARVLAALNCAMADAGIDAWQAKYDNDLWRPVVGIRSEGTGDPFWAPLGAPQTNRPGVGPRTPPFPAYPSGHATFGAASFQVLARWLGSEITVQQVLDEENSVLDIADQHFSFVSDELDGVAVDADGSVRQRLPRSYKSFARAVFENSISRVFLGVHWRFDGIPRQASENVGGVPMGLKIGNQAHDFFLGLKSEQAKS
ncbi:phosphatase PAP2 family protein [Roseateles asaccharophilus]|uniref:Membrane-associated phospholipid phosphatase n=1 Tax=Roseateles asaccharophilus TaxID=582607 RepID=A0ABU2AFY9_9BURK|nr:phosphatase PAP2 family protein [Roseateles asaccharophilus]MDR7336124.1 membrane-associated phospholipid phosphatase [Roseateles asaccharophilus]